MEIKDLFYKWVPVYVKLPVLFILFFVILTANGVFLGNTTDMYSSLGVYAEPYTAAYNAMYIGMGLGLMMGMRLKLRFSNKALLLWGLICMVLMNLICATNDHPVIIIGACLVLGFTKMAALIEVFIIWMFVWSKKGDTSRLYPFVYFTALSGLYFITWLTTHLAAIYNWRFAYIVIIILLLICLLFALVFVENHRLRRPVPLYQLDWQAALLLMAFMMLINYAAVYGKVEDWLESDKIKMVLACIPVAFWGFVKRELTVKRPLLDLRLFRKSFFRIGLFYFLLMGIFFPSSIQSAFTGGILHFEMIRNMELNLYMIPGVLAGSVLCYYWYFHKYDPLVLIFSGFLAFVVYYVILYNSLITGFGIRDFWLPSIVKGFAIVLIYIALGLYSTAGFDIKNLLTGAGVVILVRSFLGSGVFTGIYSYLLYAGRVRHLDYLAGMADADNFLVKEGRSPGDLYRILQEQSNLTASKEMTGFIILSGIVILAGIVISSVHQRVKADWSITPQNNQ